MNTQRTHTLSHAQYSKRHVGLTELHQPDDDRVRRRRASLREREHKGAGGPGVDAAQRKQKLTFLVFTDLHRLSCLQWHVHDLKRLDYVQRAL